MLSRFTKLLTISLMALTVLCGVGSLVLFIFYPIGSLSVLRLDWPEPWLLCWNAFLSCVFFFQHSGMTRRTFRARLSLLVAPRYHGAIYSITSGVALVLVVGFWQTSATKLLTLHGFMRWSAAVAGVSAMVVFVCSIFSLRTFDPLGLGPIKAHLRNAQTAPPRFIARGPYRWVRHPLYSCAIVLIWASPELTTDHLLFDLLWTAWIVIGAILEERDLIADFGDVYRDYRRHVPMLVPWRGYVAAQVPTYSGGLPGHQARPA